MAQCILRIMIGFWGQRSTADIAVPQNERPDPGLPASELPMRKGLSGANSPARARSCKSHEEAQALRAATILSDMHHQWIRGLSCALSRSTRCRNYTVTAAKHFFEDRRSPIGHFLLFAGLSAFSMTCITGKSAFSFLRHSDLSFS